MMQHVLLTRFTQSTMGTFGRFYVNGFLFYTVEAPWLYNQKDKSCVPEGVYRCSKHKTTTRVPEIYEGKTWYLSGESVGVHKGYRTAIAWHIANTIKDVRGCIGPGLGLGVIHGKWAVTNSTDAMIRLHQLLDDEFLLTIERKVNE